MAVVAVGEEDEAARRREAYARVRGLPIREEIPVDEVPREKRFRVVVFAVIGLVLGLWLIGWGVVSLAARLTAVAARAAGLGH